MKHVIHILVSTLSTVFNGYVLSTLWDWYIYEKFTFIQLNIPEAIGLMILVGFMTKQYVKQKTEYWEATVFHIAFALVALFAGWVVHFFL